MGRVSGLLRLPPEIIISYICPRLSASDKAALCVVCRSLNYTTRADLYRSISVTFEPKDPECKTLKALERTMLQSTSIVTTFIERVEIRRDIHIHYPPDYAMSVGKFLYPELNDAKHALLIKGITNVLSLPNLKVLNTFLPSIDAHNYIPECYSALLKIRAPKLESLTFRFCEYDEKHLPLFLAAAPHLKNFRCEFWIPYQGGLMRRRSSKKGAIETALILLWETLESLELYMVVYCPSGEIDYSFCELIPIKSLLKVLKGFKKLQYLEAPTAMLFGAHEGFQQRTNLKDILSTSLKHLCLRDDTCQLCEDAAEWFTYGNIASFYAPRGIIIGRSVNPREEEEYGPINMKIQELKDRNQFAPHLSKLTLKLNWIRDNDDEHQWRQDAVTEFLNQEGIEFDIRKQPDPNEGDEPEPGLDFFSLLPEYEELD